MNTLTHKTLLALTVASLAACGGGGGGDSSDSSITGTPVQGTVKASSGAVFNLSGVVTLMEYDEVVEQNTLNTQSFSLTGVTSGVAPASSNLFTTLGASNLLGINENGDTIFPVANIEPLMVDYSLLSPDQKKLYIAVSNTLDYTNFTSRINLKNSDTGMYVQRQPLIGPALEISVPLSEYQFQELYPQGYYRMEEGTSNADGSCQTGVKSDWNDVRCVTAVLAYTTQTADPIRIEIEDILNTLQEEYFSCSLVEVDRQGGPMDCVGGTTEADATVQILGDSFAFKLKTAKFNRGDSYYGTYDLESFEKIRPGLRPLQFDDAGNLYTLASRFNTDYGYYHGRELTRITPTGELEQVIGLDSTNVDTFLALSNGDIVTKVSNYNNSGTQGIYLIQNGTMIRVPNAEYADFKADTGSTFIINNKLYKSLANNEGFTAVPIKWKGQDIHDTYLTDEGELYGCSPYDGIVKVYPFKSDPVVPNDPNNYYYNCDFSTISFGYRVAIKEVNIGTLGKTEIISILRLSDGKEYEIFSEEDYNGKARYDISNLAFGGNKIIFSADRTTAPIGTVIGVVDVTLLGQGKSVDVYMDLTDVQSSVAASNSVRKITPLPVIEPLTTLSAPRISREYHDLEENSHVGFEFSEFMDKDTVLESLELKNNGMDVEYIPFWGYKKLYLIADTDGLGDSNNDNIVDDSDYQPYQNGQTYTFTFDTNVAQDVSGRTMSTSNDPNATHDFTFGTAN
ncbi:hypothetical protein GJQ54_13300 [Oceanospirillaceae bacterium ASx5O]|nr:hypothetical protein GJQ54_13300 [Oceanospirillaceae bacterium ASx5O]